MKTAFQMMKPSLSNNRDFSAMPLPIVGNDEEIE
jgi:hypothetical protein